MEIIIEIPSVNYRGLLRSIKRIHTLLRLRSHSYWTHLFYRLDAPAEKPGSLSHSGSIYAILLILELTLGTLKEKT